MSTNTPAWFKIPILEKCCCLQLKTGGIIVACFWLIPLALLSGLTTWDMIGIAVSRSNIANNRTEEDKIFNFTESIERIETWHDPILVLFAFFQSVELTLLAICVLHIYGAFKEKRLFMVPFITFLGMFTTTMISGEIMRILLLSTTWVGFLASVLLGAFGLYSFLILISYYLELKQKPSTAKDDDVIEAIEDALW